MKKWGKLLFSLLVAEAMLLPKSAVAFATDNTVDLSRTGSLSITLRESDGSHAAMQGGTFCIYEVAQAEIENANFAYIPTEDFEESGADLSDLNAPGLAEHLAAYAAAEHLSGLVDTTGADGRVTFSDLQLGLYLVMQKGTVPGYYQVSPFLVTVPLMDGNVNYYKVGEVNVISPSAVEKVKESGWDIALYTCTYGGEKRVFVGGARITREEAIEITSQNR